MDYLLRVNAVNFLFLIITLLWWLEFKIYPSQKRNNSNDQSFFAIFAVILVTILVSGFFLLLDLFVVKGQSGTIISYLGVFCYGLGLLLRYWSLYYLGPYFSRNIQVEKTQELISSGPYLKLRHPMYLGLLLLNIGVILFLRQPLMAIFSGVFLSLILNHRMEKEEKIMEQEIGERYRQWKMKRHRFIPSIY